MSRCRRLARTALAASIALLASAGASHAQQGSAIVNAKESQPGPGVFGGAANDKAPGMLDKIPPIDQLPPMPMPDINIPPRPIPLAQRHTYTMHDPKTGQDTIIEVPVDPTLTGGQAGGSLPLDLLLGSEPMRPRGMGTMTSVATRNTFPWSANCKVVEGFNNGAGGTAWYVCSGTMIDAATCLVAGHCVYNHGNGIPDGWATNVYVLPGWDGNGAIVPPSGPGSNTSYQNFGYAAFNGIYAGTGWVNSSSRDQDWGVVTLGRAVGGITGWFGTAWGYDCATVQSRTYNNTSYPAENPCGIAGLHNGQTMYFWAGTIDSCPGNRFELVTTPGCFTAVWGGMSGSSMYYIDNNTRYAHAVCSTSNRSTVADYCRLDQGAFNYINQTVIPNGRGAAFDLQALNCQIAPTSIQAGATTATQNFLLYNGSSAARNATYNYKVYLSTNDFLTSADTLLSTQFVTFNFPAGPYGLRVNMVPVTIPANTPPGNYWIGVVVDNGTDANDGNNATHNWDAVRVTITPAAPSNDTCAGSIAVGEGAYSGNNSTANNEGSTSCGTNVTKDVWFTYTASATGTVNINTCGSSFDTVLSVHSACPGTTANQIQCNDDNNGAGGNGACGGGLSSGLNLPVTAGAQYTIRVGSYNNNAGGTFLLNIVPIAPANDNCGAAVAITPGTYTGSTGFANTDGAASCGFSLSAPDVWYSITPASSGLARLDTCGSSYDTVLSVHAACPGNVDNQLGCDDDDYWNYGPCPQTLQSTVNVPVNAGTTYYVRVAGYNGRNGAYTLHYNVTPIGNDTCDAATPITFGTYTYNNTGATTDGPTEANCNFCCSDLQINQDIWYSIVAPCARPITIDTFGSSYDTKLGVYNGCPYTINQAVACNDDFSGVQSSVTFVPTAGTRYLIRVGSYSTNAGAGVLHVRSCKPDFNCDGVVNIQDIFDFLTAWFNNDPRADFNGANGIGVQDIFDFLSAWFAGC